MPLVLGGSSGSLLTRMYSIALPRITLATLRVFLEKATILSPLQGSVR